LSSNLTSVVLVTDVKLVMLKAYFVVVKCVSSNMMKYYICATLLLGILDEYTFDYVPQIRNKEANDFAQIATSYKLSKEKFDDLSQIRDKMIDEFKILNVNVLTPNDWRKPLVDYMRDPMFQDDRKIKYRTLNL